MKCPNCGKELNPSDKFCIRCGTKVNNESGAEINNGFSTGSPNMDAVNAFAENVMNGARNSIMGTGKNGVNFMVRRYFFGFGDIIWISVIVGIVGAGLSFIIPVIAVMMIIGAIVGDIYTRVIGMGKDTVDKAAQNAIAMLKERAQKKFNVDVDQIREIESIVIAGAGASPTKFIAGIPVKYVGFAGLGKFYSKDPVEAYKMGTDKVPRYLLIQTTVYSFTDTQLLVYSGNVDISTGIVYDEQVSEIFYKDVNSVTQRDVLKKFKAGLFKKEYYILKYMALDVCGISKVASFDSRFAENAATSLAGMESYIREKKY